MAKEGTTLEQSTEKDWAPLVTEMLPLLALAEFIAITIIICGDEPPGCRQVQTTSNNCRIHAAQDAPLSLHLWYIPGSRVTVNLVGKYNLYGR